MKTSTLITISVLGSLSGVILANLISDRKITFYENSRVFFASGISIFAIGYLVDKIKK